MSVDTGTPTPPTTSVHRPERSVGRWCLWAAITCWISANVYVALTSQDGLPFAWPARAGLQTGEILLETNAALLQVLLLMALVYWLTRQRPDPRRAARAPRRGRAIGETLGLLTYGAFGLAGGFFVARLFDWHPFLGSAAVL